MCGGGILSYCVVLWWAGCMVWGLDVDVWRLEITYGHRHHKGTYRLQQ